MQIIYLQECAQQMKWQSDNYCRQFGYLIYLQLWPFLILKLPDSDYCNAIDPVYSSVVFSYSNSEDHRNGFYFEL